METIIEKRKIKKLTFDEAMSITYLKDLGGKWITVEFSGSGDDGAIDDVELRDHLETYIPCKIGISSMLEEVFYNCIDDLAQWEGDWINNDGGYGTLTVDLEHNMYELSISFRTTYDASWDDQSFV